MKYPINRLKEMDFNSSDYTIEFIVNEILELNLKENFEQTKDEIIKNCSDTKKIRINNLLNKKKEKIALNTKYLDFMETMKFYFNRDYKLLTNHLVKDTNGKTVAIDDKERDINGKDNFERIITLECNFYKQVSKDLKYEDFCYSLLNLIAEHYENPHLHNLPSNFTIRKREKEFKLVSDFETLLLDMRYDILKNETNILKTSQINAIYISLFLKKRK